MSICAACQVNEWEDAVLHKQTCYPIAYAKVTSTSSEPQSSLLPSFLQEAKVEALLDFLVAPKQLSDKDLADVVRSSADIPLD